LPEEVLMLRGIGPAGPRQPESMTRRQAPGSNLPGRYEAGKGRPSEGDETAVPPQGGFPGTGVLLDCTAGGYVLVDM
jgi:hypothetical protein